MVCTLCQTWFVGKSTLYSHVLFHKIFPATLCSTKDSGISSNITDVTTSRRKGFKQHTWGLNQQQLVIKLAWMGLNLGANMTDTAGFNWNKTHKDLGLTNMAIA